MEEYDELMDDEEAIEGYCLRCKVSIEIENPQAVWTRRGMAATRGECPDCGGTVFRMGKTPAHSALNRPEAVQVANSSGGRTKLPRNTAYVAFAPADEAIARQIASDLENIGIASWLHEGQSDDEAVQWAGGVHPALSECNRLVLVLSPSVLDNADVEPTWRFFKDKRKPVVIAQITPAEAPDAIRRSPRFDFAADYKTAFRQLVQALSD